MRRAGGRAILVLLSLMLLWAGPAAARDALEEARALAAGHDYARALERLQGFLEQHPDHVEARLLQGVILTRQGHPDRAIDLFRGLTVDHPELAEPYNNLAVLYASQGRFEEARVALLEAIRVAPGYDVAHENLGDVYSKLAALAYSQAHELNRDNRRVTRKLDRISGMLRQEQITTADESPPPAAPPAGGIASAGAAPSCYVVREFADREAAGAAARWLEARGAQARPRAEGAARGALQRVFLAPFASREEAEQRIAELQRHGLRDVAAYDAGGGRWGVSLGVFSRRASVERRVAELESLGYAVQTAPQDGGAAGWRLQVSVPDGVALAPAEFAAAFPGHTLAPAECP